MMRVALALGLALVSTAALAAPAGAALAPARVTILSRNASKLLSSHRLEVRVRYGALGTVRLYGGRPRAGMRLVVARLIRFRHAGAKRIRLRVTAPAARFLAAQLKACRDAGITVLARARRYRRHRGLPLFAHRNRSRRSRTSRRSGGLKAGCRLGGRLGGGGAAGGGAPGAGAGASMRAGAASSDITPPVGTPMFAYTARSALAGGPDKALQLVADPDENLYAKSFVPSEGIHTRVRARAIVIEQGGRKFALVQTDLGGLPYALVQEVLKRIADTGITGENLLLSATHTHSSTGPIWPTDSNGYALLGGDAFDPRIFELTAQGIAEAIESADKHLEPARVGVGTSELRGASNNRSTEAFQLNPDAPADPTERERAAIDPQMTVLRVDAVNGRPIGVWSNFAIHGTSFGDGNLLFSGDNMATAERDSEAAIERDAAARGVAPPADRPVVDVWTNANEGDISPRGDPDKADGENLQYVPNSFAGANMAGNRVAGGIVAAWRDAGARMGEPAIGARRAFLAFDGTEAGGEPVGPLAVLGQGGITAPDNTCAPADDVAGPGQGKKLPAFGGPAGPAGPLVPGTVPVSVWRIGGLGIAAFPAEITKQEGARIRAALAGASGGRLGSFVIAGLTNGYVSYTATPEEYDYCGYEGSFTLFGRHQGARYLAGAQNLLAALLGGPAPATAPEPPEVAAGGGSSPVDETPDAGQVVQQPGASVQRFGRAVFKWNGGDPAVDAPRNKTFVSLQRLENGSFQTVGTDDSYLDTTRIDNDKVWTETWQFGECTPTGTYRFVVHGMADKGSGTEPYDVTSTSFQVTPTAPLLPAAVDVSGGSASAIVRYPNPGPDILTALPARVRTGTATLHLAPSGDDVHATPDADGLHFTAPVPAGTTSATVTSVQDGCGNSGP